MRENEINVFVDGIVNYFATMTDSTPEVGTPFLIDTITHHVMEYNGVIGITGEYSGNVIFTASKSMLISLISKHGADAYDNDLLLDLVGEMANIFSGNARETLGSSFEISPPLISRGKLVNMRVAKGLQTYCIPIIWLERKANLIVAVE